MTKIKNAITPNRFIVFAFTLMIIAVWALAYANDEAMAHVFHPNGVAWALFLHIGIVALPPIIAFLPSANEKKAAWITWGAALFLSLIGNVANGLAWAANVPIRQVFSEGVSLSGALGFVAICVSAIIVIFEGVVGYLWEKAISRTYQEWQEKVTIEATRPVIVKKYYRTNRVIRLSRKQIAKAQSDNDNKDLSKDAVLSLLQEYDAIGLGEAADKFGRSERTMRRILDTAGFHKNGDGRWHKV